MGSIFFDCNHPNNLWCVRNHEVGEQISILTSHREPSNWYVSLVLWVFGGILLSRTKHSMQARLTASQLVVVYTFDKREGTLTIKTTTVAGVSSEDHWLDEIYDVKFFVSKDMQGGSTADAYLCFTKGKKIKLFSVCFELVVKGLVIASGLNPVRVT